MSELSQLIEISRNIEKQNNEIIRLLRKIAGEDEVKAETQEDIFSKMILSSIENIGSEPPRKLDYNIPKSDDSQNLFDTTLEVGEVLYVENCEPFKLTIKNNEIIINNLKGNAESSDFALVEMIANESIKNNQSLSDSTVILTKSEALKIPDALKVCYDEGAKKVYMPWSLIPQLVGAPDTIVELLNITFYKTDDELMEFIFGDD